MPNSILFQQTEDPTYEPRRKALSKAFSASKLKDITKCVKEITLKEIKKVQDSGKDEIDLVRLTTSLQARIIMNVACGPNCSQKTVKWEEKDGSISDIPISDSITRLV